MFQSYQKLNEFEKNNSGLNELSIEQKLSILNGMVKQARLMRPDIFSDPFHGMQEKIEFIKLLHSCQSGNEIKER